MTARPVSSEAAHTPSPARAAAWRWQVVVIVLACCPLAHTLWELATVPVTNPSQLLQRSLGLWALRLLLITLAITPLVRWTRWYRLVPLRRTLGLASFAYACAHLSVYLWLDMGFDLHDLAFDAAKRPFIVVGALVFLCLLPLAATSTTAAVRALGARRWRALHRLAYVAVLLAAAHYVMATKVALTTPLLHGLAALVLLGLRWRARRRAPVTGSTPDVSAHQRTAAPLSRNPSAP
jgi:sulfoxide reductase heme-binding subunit YedZ